MCANRFIYIRFHHIKRGKIRFFCTDYIATRCVDKYCSTQSNPLHSTCCCCCLQLKHLSRWVWVVETNLSFKHCSKLKLWHTYFYSATRKPLTYQKLLKKRHNLPIALIRFWITTGEIFNSLFKIRLFLQLHYTDRIIFFPCLIGLCPGNNKKKLRISFTYSFLNQLHGLQEFGPLKILRANKH